MYDLFKDLDNEGHSSQRCGKLQISGWKPHLPKAVLESCPLSCQT